MQIAEQIVPSGITSGSRFAEKVTELVKENRFKRLIETGTHVGTGTTRAILNGLEGRDDFDFISIEVNPGYYRQAIENIGPHQGVHLLNGLSIGKGSSPVSVSFSEKDYPDFVVIDHLPHKRELNYLREIKFNVEDHQLHRALEAFDFKPDFVLLDSAGNLGLLEFNYLIDRVKDSFILALDDTDHVKHYDTMQVIRSKPDLFAILWEVRSVTFDPESGEKFGSAIIQYNHPDNVIVESSQTNNPVKKTSRKKK